MTSWVRSGWRDDGGRDVVVFWEVRDDGWVTRAVELHGDERVPMVAAALDECLEARDAGLIKDYEAVYGVLVEQPLDDWDFPHEDIPAAAFDECWRAARAELGPRGGRGGG